MVNETTPEAQSQQAGKQAKDEPKIEVKPVTPEPAAKAEPAAAAPGSRVGRADAIIRRNVLWALGAGVVPVPLFDLVAVTGVQLKMLAELSELYDVSFKAELAKKIVGSLFSSAVGVGVGVAVGASIAKLIPGVGSALGMLSVPALTGAFTHATGKVFMMHFEAGGTLLDFDPSAMRAYFKQEFEKAKEAVAHLKKEEEEKAKAAKPS